MRDQRLVAVQVELEILRAASQSDDSPSLQPQLKARRKWKTDVRPAELDLVDPGAEHRGLEAASDGFDLRQFRHRDGPESRRERPRHIFCSLTVADAVNAGKLIERIGALLRHFDQRPIRENDIGRLLLRRSDRAPQSLQRAKQASVRIGRRDRCSPPAARFRIDDVLAQGERVFAAQNAPTLVGQRPAARGRSGPERSTSPIAAAATRRASRLAFGPCRRRKS